MSKDNDITIVERLDRCEEGLIAIETILRTAFPTFFDPQGEQSQGEQSQGERPPGQLVALSLAAIVQESGLELVQEILAQFDNDTCVAGMLNEFDKLVNNLQEGNDNGYEKTTGSVK